VIFEHYWHKLPGPIWFNGITIYSEQVERAKDGAVFVELGVWKGRSTVFMAVEIANSGKNIEFHAVDHWRGSSSESAHQEDQDVREGRLYEVFLENIRPVKNYVHPICSDSADAAQQFPDRSVDFVYVDAGHTFAAVPRDIAVWWPKVKHGGVLSGDDWCGRGVRGAVTEFFSPRGIQVITQPGSCHPEWKQWLVFRGADELT
jgi:Methyltransferase domain